VRLVFVILASVLFSSCVIARTNQQDSETRYSVTGIAFGKSSMNVLKGSFSQEAIDEDGVYINTEIQHNSKDMKSDEAVGDVVREAIRGAVQALVFVPPTPPPPPPPFPIKWF